MGAKQPKDKEANMTNYLKNNIYHIYDTSNTAFGADPLAHFAMGDALIRLVGAEAPALTLHFLADGKAGHPGYDGHAPAPSGGRLAVFTERSDRYRRPQCRRTGRRSR